MDTGSRLHGLRVLPGLQGAHLHWVPRAKSPRVLIRARGSVATLSPTSWVAVGEVSKPFCVSKRKDNACPVLVYTYEHYF